MDGFSKTMALVPDIGGRFPARATVGKSQTNVPPKISSNDHRLQPSKPIAKLIDRSVSCRDSGSRSLRTR